MIKRLKELFNSDSIAHVMICLFVICTLWYLRMWLAVFEAVCSLFGGIDE